MILTGYPIHNDQEIFLHTQLVTLLVGSLGTGIAHHCQQGCAAPGAAGCAGQEKQGAEADVPGPQPQVKLSSLLQ